MKKISLYSLLLIAFVLPIQLQAQQLLSGGLSAENTTANKENDNVVISTHIKTSDLDLSSQEMVYVTPILYSADSTHWYQFDPVIIAGSTRYKVLQREIRLNNTKFERTPQAIVKHKKHKEQVVPVMMSVPYQPWMNNSTLVLHEDLTGCACENEAKNTYVVMTPILPVQFVPRFNIAYITPPKEDPKQRSETYAAHINFEVAKHVILPHYKDNWEVLKKVDSIIYAMREDANVNISRFKITGYASPEGNFQSNMTLSKNRAEAFVLYLIDRYKIVPSNVSTDWKGEDWDGLRNIVTHSILSNKQEVLDIIDNESNVVTRKAKLQKLAGGTTYKMMLRDYYPSLRRNEYTISFTVKDFDLEEARQMIKTKPQYLSQQEMYLVAQSYPVNSAEYKETFHTIGKFFPNDEIAVLNCSAASLEDGNITPTLEKLGSMNRAEAWNNLGIAYYNQKDYKKAEEYFTKAAQAGLSAGISNLNQLQQAVSTSSSK